MTSRILPIFAFAMMVSCQQASEPVVQTHPSDFTGERNSGILPLRAGYRWIYEEYILDEDTNIVQTYRTYGSKVTRSSCDPASALSDTVFHYLYYDPSTGLEEQPEWLFRNYEDGLYLMGGRSPYDSVDMRLLYLRYPAAVGETWERIRLVYDAYENRFYIRDTLEYSCVDTAAVFETPVGAIPCTIYRHHERPQEDDVLAGSFVYEYYSPRFGLVGRLTFSDLPANPHPQFKLVLVSTNLVDETS